MKPVRACIWDKMAVAFRAKGAPEDPRTRMLRGRWCYTPWHLAGDVRTGRWRRMSAGNRWLHRAAAALFTLSAFAVAAMGAAVALPVWRGSIGDLPWDAAWFRALVICPTFVLTLWPIGWQMWLAVGGANRAFAVPRRERTRFLHEMDAASMEWELVNRRRQWGFVIQTWRGRFHRKADWLIPFHELARFAPTVCALAMLVLFGPLFVDKPGRGFVYFISPIYLCLAAHLWLYFRGRVAVESRLYASLAASACPDCGYLLEGLAKGRSADGLEAWPGPRSCPECGSPWPLVPPPWMAGVTPRLDEHGRNIAPDPPPQDTRA